MEKDSSYQNLRQNYNSPFSFDGKSKRQKCDRALPFYKISSLMMFYCSLLGNKKLFCDPMKTWWSEVSTKYYQFSKTKFNTQKEQKWRRYLHSTFDYWFLKDCSNATNGQEILFPNQKIFSNFQLTFLIKWTNEVRDDNGFDTKLNWIRFVRLKNLICNRHIDLCLQIVANINIW